MQKEVDFQDFENFNKESDCIDRSESKSVKGNEEQDDSKREDAAVSTVHTYHPDKDEAKEEVREIRSKTLERGESDTADRFDADEQADDESHLR